MSRHASVSTLTGTGLRYDVAGRTVFSDVSFTARGGRMLAVFGPSGSGKSSLLAVLGGLARPSAGEVWLDGDPVRVGDDTLRRRVGVVLQGYGLVGALTAEENLAVVLHARGYPRNEIRARSNEILGEVGLGALTERVVEDLSGGQQQRVAVARALVGAPEVVLADEPTAELDAENRDRIMTRLRNAADGGTIVVIATHDPDVIDACEDGYAVEAHSAVAVT